MKLVGRGLCDGLGVSFFFYNLASPLVEAIYPMSLVSIAGHHLGECWTWFNSVPHFCDHAKWNACNLPSLFGVKKQIFCVLPHVLFFGHCPVTVPVVELSIEVPLQRENPHRPQGLNPEGTNRLRGGRLGRSRAGKTLVLHSPRRSTLPHDGDLRDAGSSACNWDSYHHPPTCSLP